MLRENNSRAGYSARVIAPDAPGRITMTSPNTSWKCDDWQMRAAWTAGLSLLLGFVFADFQRWSAEPQYSHGFVIPLMAVGLGIFRRHKLTSGRAKCHSAGLFLIVVGVILRLIARYLFVELADCAGLLACIAGISLLVWGRHLTLAIWPAIAFLAFMFPLPYSLEQLLSAPLQLFGASQAAWYIQAMGIPAIAQGSMIMMEDVQLCVAEACSGMRMLMVFVAISAATMIISQRTRWEKVLILFSSIPIAVACNIARIVATAAAHHWLGSETADLVFHDLSGWMMMPAAMVLLFLELRLLDWVLVKNINPQARVAASQRVPGIIPILPATSHR